METRDLDLLEATEIRDLDLLEAMETRDLDHLEAMEARDLDLLEAMETRDLDHLEAMETRDQDRLEAMPIRDRGRLEVMVTRARLEAMETKGMDKVIIRGCLLPPLKSPACLTFPQPTLLVILSLACTIPDYSTLRNFLLKNKDPMAKSPHQPIRQSTLSVPIRTATEEFAPFITLLPKNRIPFISIRTLNRTWWTENVIGAWLNISLYLA